MLIVSYFTPTISNSSEANSSYGVNESDITLRAQTMFCEATVKSTSTAALTSEEHKNITCTFPSNKANKT